MFDLGGVLIDSPLVFIAEYEAELGLPKHTLNRLIATAGEQVCCCFCCCFSLSLNRRTDNRQQTQTVAVVMVVLLAHVAADCREAFNG